ncbi:MAG: acetyl-CoA carboxylase carboxyltransferase subunit beta, partial [Aridibacter sp.]
MAWFRRDKPKIDEQPKEEVQTVKTEGVFEKCPECDTAVYKRELQESMQVCIHCDHHFRIDARSRLDNLFDDGKYEKLDEEVTSADPLEFVDTKPYKDRIKQAQEKSGLPEAIVTGKGKVGGHKVYAGAMDMSFIGGSMGSAVGEKITRIIERAIKTGGAVVIFSASGGARMQEGTLSLMQMAKISAALAQLHEAKLPYISVLTDPTTGGVTASFAMLGDVNIAEPKALIG